MSKRERPATQVITGLVRFSYVSVHKAKAIDDTSEPKYSVAILIPKKDKKTLAALEEGIKAAKKLGKTSQWNGKIPPTLKLPLRDGDIERPDDEAYHNCFFINASSKTKPGVVDEDLEEIIDPTEFYSGCWGRASVNFYPFAKSGNKGVAAGLNNVQKLKDDEKLSGGTSAAEDFGDDFDDLDDDDMLD